MMNYHDYYYLDDVPSMKSVVIDETFQDIDKNRDGRITMDEYLGTYIGSVEMSGYHGFWLAMLS